MKGHKMESFPNSIKRYGESPPLGGNCKFAGGIFLVEGGNLMRSNFDLSNLVKNNFLEILTIKIRISITCVYIKYEVKKNDTAAMITARWG